jgi:hypothetical protein
MRAALLFIATAMFVSCPIASLADDIFLGGSSHYRILPNRSAIVKTGGFAGVNSRYPLHGEFDFTERWAEVMRATATGAVCTSELLAHFENANVYAPLGPMLPAFIDVDQLLNLEGLWGERLPLGAPYDVYRFTGIINDGIPASPLESSTIELFAAQAGPWMYLWGETTPPPDSADFFSYGIKAVARTGRWSDWNNDGVVDAADYTVIRDMQSNPLANPLDWTTTYSDWQSQFGERAPDIDAMIASVRLAIATSSSQTIPEPSCLVLVALGATALIARSR